MIRKNLNALDMVFDAVSSRLESHLTWTDVYDCLQNTRLSLRHTQTDTVSRQRNELPSQWYCWTHSSITCSPFTFLHETKSPGVADKTNRHRVGRILRPIVIFRHVRQGSLRIVLPPDEYIRKCNFQLKRTSIADMLTVTTLSMRGISSSCRVHIWYDRTRMAELQSCEGRMMIDSVVWVQYINVTDTHTHTDSHVAIAILRRSAEKE